MAHKFFISNSNVSSIISIFVQFLILKYKLSNMENNDVSNSGNQFLLRNHFAR